MLPHTVDLSNISKMTTNNLSRLRSLEVSASVVEVSNIWFHSFNNVRSMYTPPEQRIQ